MAILGAAVFGAAVLQATTGIGFGLIGGPALLRTVDPATALIVTGCLSLVIAFALIPNIKAHIDWDCLRVLCLYGAAGLPVGVLIFAFADGTVLKIGAAATVLFALLQTLMPVKDSKPVSQRAAFAIGAVSGALGVALSMPGPLAAAYLIRNGLPKLAVRATMLAFFVPAYLSSVGLQLAVTGVSRVQWTILPYLVLPVLVGVAIGKFLSGVLSERAFRLVLSVVLVATIASLAYSAAMEAVS